MEFPLRSAFVAIPLERESKKQFRAIQEAVCEFDHCLRFQNPDTPHLTLQFWKEIMEIEYQQIMAQMKNIAVKHRSFTLQSNGVDTFSDHGKDMILFLSVEFSEELARLKKSSPWIADQPFHPHITIAHISHAGRFAIQKKEIMKRVLHEALPIINVDHIRLYSEIDNTKQTPLFDVQLLSS